MVTSPPFAPTRRRRWLARLLLLASPVLLLGVGEIAVRWLVPEVAERDPFLELSGGGSKFGETVIDGVPHFQVQHADLYSHNNVRFRTVKEPGTLRIFCAGGSACAGWPHGPEQTWSRYLETALRAAYPDRKVEVLNVSGHAFPAYRVRPVVEEILRFEPDLLILWSGNNEFVEKRNYAATAGAQRLARALSKHSRLFRLLLGGVAAAKKQVLPDDNREAAAFMFAQFEQVALDLRADPEQFAAVLDHYEFTIDAMLSAARSRGVPTLLLTVPSNLRDWRPNVSRTILAGDALAQWQAATRAGRKAMLEGEFERAIVELRHARTLDPQCADSAFHLAQALERASQAPEAHAEYVAARDLDLTPFRASSAVLERLIAAAKRHPAVAVVDLVEAFREAASGAAPGYDLFLDYVHPTRKGNLLAARLVFDAILDRGWLGEAKGARDFSVIEDGYDESHDLSVRTHVLYLLYHMHQEEAYRDQADATIRVLQGSGEHPLAKLLIEVLTEGRHGIDAHLDLVRRDLLGEEVPADYESRHRDWYRAHFARLAAVGQQGRKQLESTTGKDR
ncbi:MAG: hypothetical protein AB7I19_09290 [Planctomycetota bacterium]